MAGIEKGGGSGEGKKGGSSHLSSRPSPKVTHPPSFSRVACVACVESGGGLWRKKKWRGRRGSHLSSPPSPKATHPPSSSCVACVANVEKGWGLGGREKAGGIVLPPARRLFSMPAT